MHCRELNKNGKLPYYFILFFPFLHTFEILYKVLWWLECIEILTFYSLAFLDQLFCAEEMKDPTERSCLVVLVQRVRGTSFICSIVCGLLTVWHLWISFVLCVLHTNHSSDCSLCVNLLVDFLCDPQVGISAELRGSFYFPAAKQKVIHKNFFSPRVGKANAHKIIFNKNCLNL